MIQQNTPEWLEMRKSKVGASDAPPIMGVSPYKTAYQVWEDKLGLSPPNNQSPSMKRGHDLEDRARQELEKMTGLLFLPQVKFHAILPWMMASLDGIDLEGKYIAELKCPSQSDHMLACEGKIPEKYFPQVQHQLEVCGMEMCYYFSFDGTAGVIVKVYRDDKYIKKMVEKEEQFWECLQTFTAPDLTEQDYHPQTSDEWMNDAKKLLEIRAQLKGYKDLIDQEEELTKKIKTMANKKSCVGGGIKVSYWTRRAGIDYSLIPELEKIDLEKYRKKPIESYRISSIT